MTADQPAGAPVGRDGAPLDLAEFLRPGDRIVWGQACGEPQTLTELLAAQRHRLPGVSCFVGIPAAATFRPEHGDRLRFITEFGAADLRGLPLARRYERMLSIAHPAHRDALAADLEENLMSGAPA
jgi:acyl-CoA hydrolase